MPFGSFEFVNNFYHLDVCSKTNITDFIDANRAVRTNPTKAADVTDDVEEEDEEESKDEL